MAQAIAKSDYAGTPHAPALTDAATGAGYWAPGTNNIIHRGFGQYSYVFGGWDGIFYAVDARGDMYWFRYLAGDGTTGRARGRTAASGRRSRASSATTTATSPTSRA